MMLIETLGKGGAKALAAGILTIGGWFAGAGLAQAVPAFAMQTGQPCSSCHVGGFGPQLTQFGREFKMNGYTMRTVGQWDVAPVSMMAVASYIRTQRDQDSPPAPHYSTNDNLTLDQASFFLAGGFGQHFGAFVQATYDGVGRAFSWDNLDLRAVTTTSLFGSNAVLGVSLNNSPTVTDPWNTLPAWGYPYTDSGVAPGPAASPQIAGGFAQNVIGLNGYMWWNGAVYSERGFYWSPDASFLNAMGVPPGETNQINGAAPYVRVAYQGNAGDHNFEVGAFGFFSD
ncbi:MAG: cytochrome C, partial [Proteobacteria bacterium]|nr:cytochrome C [Pseudomonadota bacterium]